MRTRILQQGAVFSAFLLAFTATAFAQVTNDPNVGGQLNQAWGDAASNLAQTETTTGKGGGMGQHSRATEAANKNGGFASDQNAFGLSFNVKEDGGNAGRGGVGNVTKDVHGVHPGDGGNGQHGINNTALSDLVDPVTGLAVD